MRKAHRKVLELRKQHESSPNVVVSRTSKKLHSKLKETENIHEQQTKKVCSLNIFNDLGSKF